MGTLQPLPEDIDARRAYSNRPRVFGWLKRFTHETDSYTNGPFTSFDVIHIPGLFYAAHNVREHCGHMRFFGRPGKGWAFYSYGFQAGGAPGWAFHRRWNFGLFCIHHVGPGKAVDPEGWAITFASFKIKKEYRGITIKWGLADTFRTYKVGR